MGEIQVFFAFAAWNMPKSGFKGIFHGKIRLLLNLNSISTYTGSNENISEGGNCGIGSTQRYAGIAAG